MESKNEITSRRHALIWLEAFVAEVSLTLGQQRNRKQLAIVLENRDRARECLDRLRWQADTPALPPVRLSDE